MNGVINHFAKSIVGIRSATLSPAIIDSFKVNNTQIKFLATLNKVGNVINIYPYDIHILPTIINKLKLAGFNAYLYSKECGRINCPLPSGEEKNKIFSHLDKMAESAKISIRNIRQKYRKIDKNDRSIQEYTDEAIKMIEDILKRKKENLW